MSDHEKDEDVKNDKVPTPSEVAAKTAKSSEQVEPEKQEVFDAEYVAKLRRESAGYRTKLKELQPLLDEYQKQQDKGKSDLGKALHWVPRVPPKPKTALRQYLSHHTGPCQPLQHASATIRSNHQAGTRKRCKSRSLLHRRMLEDLESRPCVKTLTIWILRRCQRRSP